MFPNGLLILTQPVATLRLQVPRLLDHVASIISDTVYIHLQPAVRSSASLHSSFLSPIPASIDIQSFISDIYGLSSSRCQNLDIRILLNHISSNAAVPSPLSYSLRKPLSVLVSDTPVVTEAWNSDQANFLQLLQRTFSESLDDDLVVQQWTHKLTDGGTSVDGGDNSAGDLTTYDYVVLGGTFDRVHSGHRMLLSQACLLCNKKMTVGVTGEVMHRRKTLKELISSQAEREEAVLEFTQDIKPCVYVETLCITDGYGPTTVREEFQCIVVSQETAKGGTMINEERERRGLKALEVVTFDLLEDSCHAPEEEEKISSSSLRRRLLGTLLQPVQPKPHLEPWPYRIGVTGGVASGKSNVCQELEKLGAVSINCDKLGHKAYSPGTDCFAAVVAEFGQDLVMENGFIDTKKLGPIVFSDKSKLKKLNSIVWPEILRLVEQEIARLAADGVAVVVLEAAVLLEAGWDSSVHEVWTTFVAREEAIQRQIKRNQLTEEQAVQRVDSQLSNEEHIARSHVVLCPLWDYAYTRKQIQKAWESLQERLPSNS